LDYACTGVQGIVLTLAEIPKWQQHVKVVPFEIFKELECTSTAVRIIENFFPMLGLASEFSNLKGSHARLPRSS